MKKILVIEDMESVRETIINILEPEGFLVKSAENGLEGLELIKDFFPDLIICDIVMPGIDGYDVLTELKENNITASIPFIITTIKSDRDTIRQGMSRGADDYITKPFSSNELIEAVYSQLKKHERLDKIYHNKFENITKERLENLLSTGTSIIYSLNYSKNNEFTYMSGNIKTLLGYMPEDFTNVPNFWINHIHPLDKERIINKLNLLFTTNRFVEEYRMLKINGDYKWLYDERKIVCDNNGNAKEIVGSWVDITEKKKAEKELENYREHLEEVIKERTHELIEINENLHEEVITRMKAEEQVRNSLIEKEILLKEIHHRVKNNLQFISSMLRLHGKTIKNKDLISIFKDIQSRITMMGIIHEKLYNSKNFSTINFSDYLNTLINNIFYYLNDGNKEIKINTNISNITLNVDTAISCGLILNELLTNSLKYAFKHKNEGMINIEFHKKPEEHYIIKYSDNGIGMSEHINFDTLNTFGLQLVKNSVEQLGGHIEMNCSRGLEVNISF